MKAGISTIVQTLTPEASTVLNHSIAEAGRRIHGQTTPLHVAATLLAPQNGLLRQACIRSNPNSSHRLQCRALELCFSVALERLPSAVQVETEPPVSNALIAALKRAQAHQRRGCPEQQQQPLLAVKVELEQLVISILDDPSVSRVMREASFSSPAVEATIEKTLSLSGNSGASSPVFAGLGIRPTLTPVTCTGSIPGRNMYLNPKLQQGVASSLHLANQKGDEVKRVLEILIRTKKRNPIVVGESEPESIVKELQKRIKNKEIIHETALKNLEFVQLGKDLTLDKAQIPSKISDVGILIESQISKPDCGGVMLNLGDLKWLVEQPSTLTAGGLRVTSQNVISEAGRVVVEEVRKLLAKYAGLVWLIGTATCETYMRCQVYYNNMEGDWDLQAVPFAAKAPQPGMFPRLGVIGNVHGTTQSLSSLKNLMTIPNASFSRSGQNLDSVHSVKCCPHCTQKYEEELAETVTKTSEDKSEAAQLSLPLWLQNTKSNEDRDTALQSLQDEQVQKLRSKELQKKWKDTCWLLHPTFHKGLNSEGFVAPTPLTVSGLYNSKQLGGQTNPPKLQEPKTLGNSTPQPRPILSMPGLFSEPTAREAINKPASPVRTELVLGRNENPETRAAILNEGIRDLISCISSEPQNVSIEIQANKLLSSLLDADSFKKLLRNLTEKVWWQ